jgi:sodium/hydrogen exchanger-like protein 6/7
VDINLYALVFGESVLNDAVAIVMSRALEDYEESMEADPDYMASVTAGQVLLKIVLEFLGIFLASFAVGSSIACATALLTKFTHIKQHPTLEATLFILMSYSSFLLAETLELTGIVAVLFCGICQAHYTYNNMSEETKQSTKQFFGEYLRT